MRWSAAESDGPRGQSAPAEPLTRTNAYAGLSLRQNSEGVVVSAVYPGPFGGNGVKSPSLWRGDLIVSMNGKSLDAAGYVRLVQSLNAGDILRVVYRRAAKPDPYAALARGDPEGQLRSVDVVLDDAAKWQGTIGRGLPSTRVIGASEPGEFENLILEQADAFGLRAPAGVDALLASLASLQTQLLDPNSLPAVAQALRRPLSLDRIEADFAAQIRPLAEPRPLQETLAGLHQLILRSLNLPDLQSQSDLAEKLSAAGHDYRELAVHFADAIRSRTLMSNPQFARYLELVRASPRLVPLAVAMLPHVAQRAAELEAFARQVAAAPQPLRPELAERVRAAVDGPVLGAKLVDGALWVVGGDGPNRYRMDLLVAVFDLGGPDTYTFPARGPGSSQIVIDESGNDRYESQGDFAGPGAAVFAVTVIHDRGGDDRYVSHHQGSIAAGLFGVGVLIDEAGNDSYIDDTDGAGWSQGAGVYGAGVLIDRGGDDHYDAEVLAQGVGGPGGLGLVLDSAGDDSYRANSTDFLSNYGTPGAFLGLSQGMGLGLRGYAAGGLGALYDLAGDDLYWVGEFGQGSGYFQGLGILHDGAGSDQYIGTRYAQGSAAHQAAGLLVDDAGDDSYTCTGPSAQAAAWDQSVAMLVDRAGDDTYVAGTLGQGAAAHQAVGVFIDLDGRDLQSCTAACLGRSGDNGYHYETDRVFSFSMFIDRGGRSDTYPPPRTDNLRIRSGGHEPSGSTQCCGLFVDE